MPARHPGAGRAAGTVAGEVSFDAFLVQEESRLTKEESAKSVRPGFQGTTGPPIASICHPAQTSQPLARRLQPSPGPLTATTPANVHRSAYDIHSYFSFTGSRNTRACCSPVNRNRTRTRSATRPLPCSRLFARRTHHCSPRPRLLPHNACQRHWTRQCLCPCSTCPTRATRGGRGSGRPSRRRSRCERGGGVRREVEGEE